MKNAIACSAVIAALTTLPVRGSPPATHRLEATPGGLVVNINDRCAITLVLIFPLPMCKIGRMPANGTLFEHMDEPPAGTISAH